VLIAHGTLPDQRACEASASRTVAELQVNFTATIALLILVAQRMQAQGSGTIAVITSVAGDRGRQSNFVYGAAKGGVSLFLQGLRHRLAGCGVRVVDIRPGFVDTPMTAAFDKGGLWATPARVAQDIERALDRGTPVLYTPYFWRWIMLVVRSLPTFLFHRTRL
jgi:decaprenylphospho-beta-D-erythro-pentofuranosid-2-ulose 2-reductase